MGVLEDLQKLGQPPTSQPLGETTVAPEAIPGAPPPPTGGVLDDLQRLQDERGVLGLTVGQDPVQTRRNKKLSSESGLPEEAVAADPDAVSTATKAKELDEKTQNSPKARWVMINGQTGPAAHDDVDVWTRVENAVDDTLKAGEVIFDAFTQAAGGILQTFDENAANKSGMTALKMLEVMQNMTAGEKAQLESLKQNPMAYMKALAALRNKALGQIASPGRDLYEYGSKQLLEDRKHFGEGPIVN